MMNLSRNRHPLNYHLTRLAVLLSLVLTLSAPPLAPTSRAAEVAHFNERTDFSQDFFNDCTGEVVALTGSIHTRGTLVADGAENLHIYYSTNLQHLEGVGQSSGTIYVGNATSQSGSGFYNSGSTIVFSEDIHTQLSGRGKAGNLTMHATIHYTVVNGNVTASVTNSWLACH